MTRPVLLRRSGSTLGVSYVGHDEIRAYTIPPRDVLHEDGFEIEAVLLAKPDTNRFAFPLEGYESFQFDHQPALANLNADGATWEVAPHGGTWHRAIDVVDSWSIHERASGDKVFHVYRPRITDANGISVWGQLEYADGVFTVVAPQAFLDHAAYPVVVDPTFGFTSAGASDDDPGGNLILVKASTTPGSSGTLDSVTAWGRIQSLAPVLNPAIYSDSAGVPNARLGFVDSGGTAFTGSDSQITTAIPGSVSISSGVQYWLGVSTNNAGGNNPFIKYDSTTGVIYFGGVAGAWPASITGYTQVTGVKWSVYGNYTAGGGGGRTFFVQSSLDGLSASGPKQFNPSLG